MGASKSLQGIVVLDENGDEVVIKTGSGDRRLGVDTTIAPGQSVSVSGPTPTAVNQIFREYCENGGSEDLRVDGSVTPVDFAVNADASDDIQITEIRLLLVVSDLKEEGDQFGNDSKLTNGVLVSIRSNSTDRDLINITLSEHFRELFSPAGTVVDRTGNNDAVSAGLFFGGAITLVGGSGDYVRVRIRDDLTSGDYKYFTATVYGVQVS